MAGRLFGRSGEKGPAAPSLPPGLNVEPRPITVTLFTADGVGQVQMLAGSGRFTELLNGAEPIRVRAMPDPEQGTEPAWVEVDMEQRNEILAVAPPPQDTNPLLRLHRPMQEVNIRIGPYLITGQAHVPAGSEAIGFLMRHRPHFTPLTRATVRENDEEDVKAAVLIVNLLAADGLTSASLDARQSAAAPETAETPAVADAPRDDTAEGTPILEP
jgi:hypothetical protein